MFAKGSRFVQSTISPTPGPSDYNPQEPNFDAYKRGAFLEKTERFQDREPSPPVAESTMNRCTKTGPTHKSVPSITTVDRYAILQRKVEELEHVHQEGKKAHQNDLDRLRTELAKYQKQHMDNTELIEKERKKNTLLEARVRELKRTNGSEESELKEARSKLRSLENERNRLQANSTEVQDLKNALQSLETKLRDEVRDRDSRISELEKSLAEEKKAREALATQHQSLKRASESEARVATRRLQTLVDQKTAESSKLQEQLSRIQGDSSSREEELVSRLEAHKDLLSHVASEYGRLFSQSISKASFESLEDQQRAAQLHTLKLERKLASSEAQVVELVYLVRQIQSDNVLLTQQLHDALEEISLARQHLLSSNSIPELTPFDDLFSFQQDAQDEELEATKLDAQTSALLADFYLLHASRLAISSRLLDRELAVTDTIAHQSASQVTEVLASHEAIASRLEQVSTNYARSAEEAARGAADIAVMEREVRHLNMKVEERDALLAGIEAKHKQALKKERDSIQRLNSTLQKERQAEDALRAEIDKLETELQGLEWYETAYTSLSSQISLLLSRNALAESEAALLTQANAQLLGHSNPAQRIMYVDRIRRELAEAKHRIAELTLENETAEAQNSQLQQELQMYTSVMVPVGSRPRTGLTRVTRVPLSNVSESLNQSEASAPVSRGVGGGLKRSQDVYTSPSDMTVDDLS